MELLDALQFINGPTFALIVVLTFGALLSRRNK
jgi:hypothetical protein